MNTCIAASVVLFGLMMIVSCMIYVYKWTYRHKKPKGW